MLKEWPSAERPREKLLLQGANSLSDAELLAIFLRTGVKGCNVVELSRQLLKSFGSISAIFKANLAEFSQKKGLGEAKYVQLQACLELSKRYLYEQVATETVLTSSQATKNFLIAELRGESREVFAALFLDTQHQVITFEKLFFGTLNAAAVYPRVVLEKALHHQAGAVIFCHNHPSGITEASQADKQITRQLINALSLVDIRVLDHVIVGGHQCYSFAEQGELG